MGKRAGPRLHELASRLEGVRMAEFTQPRAHYFTPNSVHIVHTVFQNKHSKPIGPIKLKFGTFGAVLAKY